MHNFIYQYVILCEIYIYSYEIPVEIGSKNWYDKVHNDKMQKTI
jgi:hypothetical protein